MRPYNFSAGPGVLPQEVLTLAREEMLDWHGTGTSVMEMSHRSSEFASIAAEAEADLRELLAVPDSYSVLFLQGGASAQFAAIPLNLAGRNQKTDYLVTGFWSQKAFEEASRYSRPNLVASGKGSGFRSIPESSSWQTSDDAAYFHYCDNETIHGVEFEGPPQVEAPLVVDASSNIFSRPLDISRHALIYAGAQKNFGPAGLTLVIVRRDLLSRSQPEVPSIFDYRSQSENDSMVNTPPTYSWYIAGLTFKWLKKRGGIAAMQKVNEEKAALLYKTIDQSINFENNVSPAYRSAMNVPFFLSQSVLDKDAGLEKRFLAEARQRGLLSLAGHRSLGGFRASIYNAMPLAGVEALSTFIHEFDQSLQ